MKIFKLLCTALLTVSLVACGGSKANKIKTDGANTIDGYMNYEVLYAQVTDKIEPPILKGYYTYYKAKSTSNTLVDLVLKVENTSAEEIKLADLKGTFTVADKDYQAIKVSEEDTSVSTSKGIASKETKNVHLYAEVDKKTDFTKDIKFVLEANETESELTFVVSNLEKKKDYQKSGYQLKDDKAEITIDKITIKDQVNPEKPTGVYRYYKPTGSNNTFAALKLSVKNIGTEDLAISKLIGSKAYIGNSTYPGQTVIQNEAKSSLYEAEQIKPGKTHTVYLLAQVPKADKDKDIEMSVYYAGTEIFVKK